MASNGSQPASAAAASPHSVLLPSLATAVRGGHGPAMSLLSEQVSWVCAEHQAVITLSVVAVIGLVTC